MKNSTILISTLIVNSIITSGCANLNEKKKESIYTQYINEKKLVSQKKITSFRFQGWQSLDNEYLILNTSFSKPYLIDLAGYCNDLRFTQTIAIHSSGSTLHARFDSISVPNNHSIKCRIDSIYKITREQAKEISSLDSKKSPEES